MSQYTTQTGAHGPGQQQSECCGDADCKSGLRNRYFLGKHLSADSFKVEQTYLVERQRLINRAIHGWGVVYGYAVPPKVAPDCPPQTGPAPFMIGEGLALDEHGRELVQVESVPLDLEKVIALDRDRKRIRNGAEYSNASNAPVSWGYQRDGCWMLRVHYAEQKVAPVKVKDPCSCDQQQWDQVCETVRYSLQPILCSECCIDQPCELDCDDCGVGPCCEDPAPDKHGPEAEQCAPEPTQQREQQATQQSIQERQWRIRKPSPRGGCRCLCDHLTHDVKPGAACKDLTDIDDRTRVDLNNGVALACITLQWDTGCGGWKFQSVHDACGPRRLVKRNDLLFDLIRGCDLTHISAISWDPWHRNPEAIAFEKFRDFFGKPGKETSLTEFWVDFSQSVRIETLNRDCFAMTVIVREAEGGWGDVLRVPIVQVNAEDIGGGLTRRATLVVRAAWLRDAIHGLNRFGLGARVEIAVHGDLILDCNGQAVDANAVGRRPVPSGNGSPGGTYLSVFRVKKPVQQPGQDPGC